MRCSTIRKRLSAYLDGETGEEERSLISMHLKSCEECRKESQMLSQVSELLDSLEKEAISPYFSVRLKQRIADQESVRLTGLNVIERVKRVAAPLAAVTLVLASVLFGGQMGRGIYRLRAETSSALDVEIASLVGVASLTEYSGSSLGDAYGELLKGDLE